MAFVNMYSELVGCVPKLPEPYAKTLINRAWRDVRRQNLWSFLLFEANWTTPSLITGGTVTTTQGANTVVFDSTASPLIAAFALTNPFPTPITQRQFRIGVGTVYNIWSFAETTGIVTLTLDRPYAEASVAESAYTIYQSYYPSPMKDFWQWIRIRDMVNWNDLITTKQRTEIDMWDPQRTMYFIPTHVVPYQVDQNPASPTYTWLLHELWGVPQYALTYQLYGLRKGSDLVNNSDMLPPQIGEDCVMGLARAYAYEWAEANWQSVMPNARSKPDFRFLIADAKSDYSRLFREYRRQDRATIDNFRTKLERQWAFPNLYGWFSSIAGVAGPGAPWAMILASGVGALCALHSALSGVCSRFLC